MLNKVAGIAGRLAIRNNNSLQRSIPLIVNNVAKMTTLPKKDSNVQYGKVPEELKRLQKKFQEPNDVPVFLKGGAKDVMLYRLTIGLCVVGFASSAHFFFTKIFMP